MLKAQFSRRTSRRAPDLGVQALPAPASHQRIELKSRKSGQVFAGSLAVNIANLASKNRVKTFTGSNYIANLARGKVKTRRIELRLSNPKKIQGSDDGLEKERAHAIVGHD